MTANVEIYTRPGCGYCSAAKSLLAHKRAAFTEFDVAQDPAFRQRDVPTHGAAQNLPSDFHRPNPCRWLQ